MDALRLLFCTAGTNQITLRTFLSDLHFTWQMRFISGSVVSEWTWTVWRLFPQAARHTRRWTSPSRCLCPGALTSACSTVTVSRWCTAPAWLSPPQATSSPSPCESLRHGNHSITRHGNHSITRKHPRESNGPAFSGSPGVWFSGPVKPEDLCVFWEERPLADW